MLFFTFIEGGWGQPHEPPVLQPLQLDICKKRCPADLLIPFAGTIGQDLCLGVTVTAALKFVTSLPSLVWAQKAYKITIDFFIQC